MKPSHESAARAHLHRSEMVFIAAAAACIFGVGFGYESLFFLWGNQGASLGVWALYLVGFAASLWATSVLSKTTRVANR